MVDTPDDDIEIYEEDEKPFDAGDPSAVNNARKKSARLRKKRLDFVKAVMGMPEGRIWLYDILAMCHVAEPVHTPGDPYATAYKDGERNIANKILADIGEAAPDKYMLMLSEGKSEK